MDRIQDQMMDDSQFQEVMAVLNGIVERIKQLENAIQKNSPSVTQRLVNITDSKSGTLSSLPTVGRLVGPVGFEPTTKAL